MSTHITTDPIAQQKAMQRYYRWQSMIYDITRWAFLFGRKEVLQKIPLGKKRDLQILEVGCGTGMNLVALAKRFPKAEITGLDVSPDMIIAARRKIGSYGDRIQLKEMAYDVIPEFARRFDVILFSYSLSMINPQWQELLMQAKTDLKTGGVIVITDFSNSRYAWFKKHMARNHVRMDGHLLPVLKKSFLTHFYKEESAYGAIWEYLMYVGMKVE